MGTRIPLPEGARLRVLSVSARIEVEAEDVQEMEIDPDGRRVEVSDDKHVVETRTRSTNLKITVPEGTDVSVGSVSRTVSLKGRIGRVNVRTGSRQVGGRDSGAGGGMGSCPWGGTLPPSRPRTSSTVSNTSCSPSVAAASRSGSLRWRCVERGP